MKQNMPSASPGGYRGYIHFSPPSGWLNDPNGFSWYGGEYHLFYQHHPHDSVWGPMHWGHAVSKDLVSWTHLPIALIPGEAYDADGCFSGSAVDYRGTHTLMYTGHVDPDPRDPSRRREVQCLAFGDGSTYRKAAENPVIDGDLLPPGASPGDFRDPKFWREGDYWYCLCASRHRDGHGQLLLFGAEDLTRWRFIGTARRSEGRLGGMWECPDFFCVGGREVMMWSVMGQARAEGAFQNPHSVVWGTGRLDRGTGEFSADGIAEVDSGADFYAPQTLAAPDGRIILIGWMQMWERSNPTHDMDLGWAGQMTIPRELSLESGSLVQKPVRELEAYRGPEIRRRARLTGPQALEGLRGQRLDLELEFELAGAARVGVRFFKGEAEETVLSWEAESGWLRLDRSRGGVPIVSKSSTHPECQEYRARVAALDGVLRLRIILDRSSAEVFAQGGSTVMSATVYPGEGSDGLEFFSEGGAAGLGCRAWPILEPR
jgi:beta-fructofuranosidase